MLSSSQEIGEPFCRGFCNALAVIFVISVVQPEPQLETRSPFPVICQCPVKIPIDINPFAAISFPLTMKILVNILSLPCK
jgi:hypothetical protein